ncbi:hypothetical protein QQS21_009260 [Conoideocrella luteorostrata]|uniref:Uncharacterized protein n=1 Tax=Conoideocrella luteorostrata TaxID=1105319 RepID=A0AAJ0FQK9_9HYPO|nr:hypothetical protein QQS21_009260 [Conoideocrella luteorostrata]
MVRLLILALASFAVIAASISPAVDNSTANTNDSAGSMSITGAYIVECESSHDTKALAEAIAAKGGRVRRQLDSDVFHGISVQFVNKPEEIEGKSFMKQMKGVKRVWPMRMLDPMVERQPGENSGDKSGQKSGEKSLRHFSREVSDDNPPAWSHYMTQVTKLHEEGFKGHGIKIAVIDTGVNYRHSALGGCFGRGCRVAFGDNFSNEGVKGNPMDCVGHGTRVAGVLAGNNERDGFIGTAPHATLMAYKVVGCKTPLTEDNLIAGWLKAYEDGAQIIVSGIGFRGVSWAQTPAAIVASRIVARGIPSVVDQGVEDGEGLFFASSPATGRGVMAVNSFARSPEFFNFKKGYKNKHIAIESHSAFGPTWDLDIKPNVAAPGHYVPVTDMDGGYDRRSSYASPLVAGIIALIAEARGSIDPALISSLLISMAEPRKKGDGLITVARQGGGLVKAWEAAHANTLVQPAGLTFNDTEHRVASISLRITNVAKSDISYQLSNLAALTLFTLPDDGSVRPKRTECIHAAADIKLSKASLTLGPGQSATVDVSAADPAGVDHKRLPVWSGWIAITGSDGKNLTVPYLGLAGSLRSATVFASKSLKIDSVDKSDKEQSAVIVLPDPPLEQQIGTSNVTEWRKGIKRMKAISIQLRKAMAFASSQVRADIVPLDICPPGQSHRGRTKLGRTVTDEACVPSPLVVDSAGLQSIGQLPDFPWNYAVRQPKHFAPSTKWDGSIAPDRYAPPGRYKIVARALSVFGDADNTTDWQTAETVDFYLAYKHNMKSR